MQGNKMTLNELLSQLKTQPDSVEFDNVIETINNNYSYTPSRFTNGQGDDLVINDAGTNEGSCKIFAFALLNKLSKQQALACFGKYYRQDVLLHPAANDHANIRTLIKYSLNDIKFDNAALTAC